MEQRELLCAVRRIVRVVDVYDEFPGRLVVGLDEGFQQSQPDAIEVRAADTVFQTRHRRLTGQIVSRQGQTVARGFQTRIATQVVTVIGVLVPTGDLEDALPDEVGVRMVDIALMSAIRHRLHDSLHDPGAGFRLSQQQGAPITGGRAAVKVGFDLFARDVCKRQRDLRSFHPR